MTINGVSTEGRHGHAYSALIGATPFARLEAPTLTSRSEIEALSNLCFLDGCSSLLAATEAPFSRLCLGVAAVDSVWVVGSILALEFQGRSLHFSLLNTGHTRGCSESQIELIGPNSSPILERLIRIG